MAQPFTDYTEHQGTMDKVNWQSLDIDKFGSIMHFNFMPNYLKEPKTCYKGVTINYNIVQHFVAFMYGIAFMV